jgi:hypothetical protein
VPFVLPFKAITCELYDPLISGNLFSTTMFYGLLYSYVALFGEIGKKISKMGLPDQMCQATAAPAQIDMGQKLFRLKNVQTQKMFKFKNCSKLEKCSKFVNCSKSKKNHFLKNVQISNNV